MEMVLRATVIYFAVFLLLRIAGRRTLGEMTAFDLVLLLLISEGCQQGLLGDDYSVTNAIVVCATLVSWEILLTAIRMRSTPGAKLLDGVATVLIRRGVIDRESMRKSQVDELDLLVEARRQESVLRIEDIDYAILESEGKISIIPKRKA